MPKAKNLRFLRKKAWMTQQALADATGFAKSTINAWETLKRSMPRQRTIELADFFGVSYEDFCKEDFEHIASEADHGRLILTADEEEAIKMFRAAPPDFKKVIASLLKAIHENTT